MGRYFSFILLSLVKLASGLFFRYDEKWLNIDRENVDWDDIRLIVFLNHTSLFEPIFLKLAPSKFLWRASNYLVAPGADITLNRPILGRFLRFLLPGLVSITRKKDDSWNAFLGKIGPKSLVAILPEGRMKRADGKDKDGQPMSVRGGIAEILRALENGKALFVYSGGLHHIQAPGQKLPKLFKKVKVNLELLSISKYKRSFQCADAKEFKKRLIKDLNLRLIERIPK